jgi:hypothetical protein
VKQPVLNGDMKISAEILLFWVQKSDIAAKIPWDEDTCTKWYHGGKCDQK